jgi:ParB/Sulfiredoxin domain
MARKKQPQLKRVRSKATYEQLVKVEQKDGRTNKRPKALRVHELYVADRVFQWRLPKKNWFEDERHTQELVRVISEHKKPLDPILVTAIGAKFYVVDGHHRVDAYHTVGWTRPVPVEYFEGGLNEARVEAFKRNSKNKLSMTREDKYEGAWRLVKEGEHTQVQIAAITTVSVRTISTMGSTLLKYGERAWKKGPQKDFLVCLCCGFASLWGVILSDNGMILSGQYRHQQDRYGHL